MQIALLGGTGDIGEGLALRWGRDTDYDLVVGSRTSEKARQRSDAYNERIHNYGGEASINGASNADAVVGADIVVLSIPPSYIRNTIEAVVDSFDDDVIIVSPAVPMYRDGNGFHYEQPETAASFTAATAQLVPDGITTVGAFHNIPAGRLQNLDTKLNIDTAIVADDEDAAQTVKTAAEGIEGLRAISAGPISNAPEIEGITPLLINLAMNNNDIHDIGVRFN